MTRQKPKKRNGEQGNYVVGQDQKLQEFRMAGSAMSTTPSAHANPGLLASGLVDIFSTAHGEDANREYANLARQVREGVVTPDQLNIRVGGTEAIILQRMLRQSEAKKSFETQLFLNALNTINERIDYLNDNIEQGLDSLKADYGEDYIGVVAASVLTPEEIEGCETEDEILVLMAEKAFDEDGNLRPGFEHLDPRLLKILEEVREREVLILKGQGLIDEYKQNGHEITPELKPQLQRFGENSDNETITELERENGNSEALKIADDANLDSFEATLSGGI